MSDPNPEAVALAVEMGKNQEFALAITKFTQDAEEAGRVPPLDLSVQEKIKADVAVYEERLNVLFSEADAINPSRKRVASSVEFLSTPEFYNEITLRGKKIRERSWQDVVRFVNITFNLGGEAVTELDRVAVHTTTYDPDKRIFQQIDEAKAAFVAKHDMTHAKALDRKWEDDPFVYNQHGVKTVVYSDNEIIDVYHQPLDEALTDALVIIGSHAPKTFRSWMDVWDTFNIEEGDCSHERQARVYACCVLMNHLFPKFWLDSLSQLQYYFQSDGPLFIDKLHTRIKKGNFSAQTRNSLNQIIKASQNGKATMMMEEALTLTAKETYLKKD